MLSDKEHVIRRPAMYIGSTTLEPHDRFLFGEFKTVTYVPGLIKLIDEILDNSLDEAIRTSFKYANEINVSIKDLTVTVSDNGRGIPQSEIITPEGESLPGPVVAWTRTKAGGNFGADEDRKTAGTNGVGSSLTNIFSSSFIGTTCDGTTELTVNCSNGADNISWKSKPSKKNGTSVAFIPDLYHFGITELDDAVHDITLDRLQTLAVIYPDIKFKFNGKIVQGNFKQYAKRFDEDAIILDNECSIAIGKSEDGFRQLSYVNGLCTKNGGSHVDYIINELTDGIIPMIKRKYKIDINKARIKECLTLIVFIRDMSNLRFDSQTKERLTNPVSDIKSAIDVDFKKLARTFMSNEAILMPIIQSVLARKEAADAAADARAAKNAKRAKVAKHIKANKCGTTQNTTLHIAEGQSAIGYLLETRDRNLHGGYAIRGKFLTTWNEPAAKILKNAEVFDICAITGLVLGTPLDKCDLQYQNLMIMTDADVDGTGSISPALLAFFSNWPELFEQRRIRILKTPIAICKKGSDIKWYYNLPEFDSDRQNLDGYDIRYIKGLGSLEKTEYEKIINDPVYEVIELPENWRDKFELLYGDDADARKAWMSA